MEDLQQFKQTFFDESAEFLGVAEAGLLRLTPGDMDLDEVNAIEQGREYDKSAKYADDAEAIADAVANSDLSDCEADMLAEFEAIPVGYFIDEETL